MQLRYTIGALFVMALAMAPGSCGGGTGNPSPESDDRAATVPTPELNLLTAIDQEQVDIVQQHMDAGTDSNKNPIPVGITLVGAFPLHLAVVKGNRKIVQILLDNGAELDLKAENKDGARPLH